MDKQLNKQHQLGRDGEDLVAHYLEKQGFKIIARNYRMRSGEIDLIAENNDTIAFVEVKNRLKVFFDLSSVITRSKQKKIISVAKAFLLYHTGKEKMARFDVALIEGEGTSAKVSYLPNAFDEGDATNNYSW